MTNVFNLRFGDQSYRHVADVEEAKRWFRCALRWSPEAIDALPVRTDDVARFQREYGLSVPASRPFPQFWAVIETHVAFGNAFRALNIRPYAWQKFRNAWREMYGDPYGDSGAVGRLFEEGLNEFLRQTGESRSQVQSTTLVRSPNWPPRFRIKIGPEGAVSWDEADITWPGAEVSAYVDHGCAATTGINAGQFDWRCSARTPFREGDVFNLVWLPPLLRYFEVIAGLARQALSSRDLVTEVFDDVVRANGTAFHAFGAFGRVPPPYADSGLALRPRSTVDAWVARIQGATQGDLPLARGAAFNDAVAGRYAAVESYRLAIASRYADRFGRDFLGRQVPPLELFAADETNPPRVERARICGEARRDLWGRATLPGTVSPPTIDATSPGLEDFLGTTPSRPAPMVPIAPLPTTGTGIVRVDLRNAPEGVQINVILQPNGKAELGRAPDRIDRDGHKFSSVPAGNHNVAVVVVGRGQADFPVAMARDGRVVVDADLSAFPALHAQPGAVAPVATDTATTPGTVFVQAATQGAEIRLDGHALPGNPNPAVFSGVEPGTHTVRVSASGRKAHAEFVTVRSGWTTTVQVVDLVATADDATPDDGSKPDVPTDDVKVAPPPPRPDIIATVGPPVVPDGGGGGVVVVAPPPRGEERSSTGTVLAVGGVAAVVAGVLYWLTDRK